jgi:hypothetical protein
MHHAGFVDFLEIAQKFVGIENDLAPAVVAVLAEIERQQAGLQAMRNLGVVVDIRSAGGRKRFVVDEQAGGFAQARPLRERIRPCRIGRAATAASKIFDGMACRSRMRARRQRPNQLMHQRLTRQCRAGAQWLHPDVRARPARSAGSGG